MSEEGWNRFQGNQPIINKSFIYLFPMIGLTNSVQKGFFINLEGVFLLNEDYPQLKDKLYILFRMSTDQKYRIFEQGLLNASYYNFNYEPDKYYKIFVFDIPAEYKREYLKFLVSKYSEFSDNYKKSIIKFHKYKEKGEGHAVINVLYKKEEAYLAQENQLNEGLPRRSWINIPRDQEIGKKWDENPESLSLEMYTKDMKLSYKDDKTSLAV